MPLVIMNTSFYKYILYTVQMNIYLYIYRELQNIRLSPLSEAMTCSVKGCFDNDYVPQSLYVLIHTECQSDTHKQIYKTQTHIVTYTVSTLTERSLTPHKMFLFSSFVCLFPIFILFFLSTILRTQPLFVQQSQIFVSIPVKWLFCLTVFCFKVYCSCLDGLRGKGERKKN